ncbi:unnamed protein product [Chrysoparadoxa australica]
MAFWKPGEARPSDKDSSPKGKGKGKGKGKRKDRDRQKEKAQVEVEPPVKAAIGAKARSSDNAPKGPSKGLLAMQFMKRRAQAEEQLAKEASIRRATDEAFDTEWARALQGKSTEENVDDELVCLEEAVDPLKVILGRRSFGGFNSVIEVAYARSVNQQLRRPRTSEASAADEEMVKDLKKYVGLQHKSSKISSRNTGGKAVGKKRGKPAWSKSGGGDNKRRKKQKKFPGQG